MSNLNVLSNQAGLDNHQDNGPILEDILKEIGDLLNLNDLFKEQKNKITKSIDFFSQLNLEHNNSDRDLAIKEVIKCFDSYYRFLNQKKGLQNKMISCTDQQIQISFKVICYLDIYLKSPCEFDLDSIQDLLEELKTCENDLEKLQKQLSVDLNECEIEEFQKKLNEINKFPPDYIIQDYKQIETDFLKSTFAKSNIFEQKSLVKLSQQEAEELSNITTSQKILNDYCKLVYDIYQNYIQLVKSYINANRHSIHLLQLGVEIQDIKSSKQQDYQSKLLILCQEIDDQTIEQDQHNTKKIQSNPQNEQIDKDCQVMDKQFDLEIISQLKLQYSQILDYINEKKREKKQKIKQLIINDIKRNKTKINQKNKDKKIKDIEDQIKDLDSQIRGINLTKNLKEKYKQKQELQVKLVNLNIDFQKQDDQYLDYISKRVNQYIETLEKKLLLMQIREKQSKFDQLKQFLTEIYQKLTKITFID